MCVVFIISRYFIFVINMDSVKTDMIELLCKKRCQGRGDTIKQRLNS
jgi:hypothetical protein